MQPQNTPTIQPGCSEGLRLLQGSNTAAFGLVYAPVIPTSYTKGIGGVKVRKSSPDNAGCHLPTAAATKSTQGMQATQAQPLSTAPPKPLWQELQHKTLQSTGAQTLLAGRSPQHLHITPQIHLPYKTRSPLPLEGHTSPSTNLRSSTCGTQKPATGSCKRCCLPGRALQRCLHLCQRSLAGSWPRELGMAAPDQVGLGHQHGAATPVRDSPSSAALRPSPAWHG